MLAQGVQRQTIILKVTVQKATLAFYVQSVKLDIQEIINFNVQSAQSLGKIY